MAASQQPVASPDGLHIASIAASRLQIRSTTALDVFRSIALPLDDNAKIVSFRWAPTSTSQPWSYRILVADAENVRVWDLRDHKWTVTIHNGSGGMGKIVHADFGHGMDEVRVTSDFGSKLTIWSLASGRTIEVRDPKYASSRGCAIRPAKQGAAKILALLSRPGPQDVLTLHAPRSHNVLRTVALSTHDAQGLKWSPDGRWIAIWESPSAETKIFIYTADGHLYRIYDGEAGDGQQPGLGVRSIEWSPRGDYLAVGGYDRRVTMLSTRTFSPSLFLEHTSPVHIPGGDVWQEEVVGSSKRTYAIAAQPVSPPLMSGSNSESSIKAGISTLSFNTDGSLLATRDDTSPTVVWIWDLSTLEPRAVILQHSPVKRISWHPTRPDLLLMYCIQDEPTVYLWTALTDSPMVLMAPMQTAGGHFECNWIHTGHDKKPSLLLSDGGSSLVGWPDGKESPPERCEEPSGVEASDHSDESLDSVVEMLAGRTPMRDYANTTTFDATMDDDFTAFDDTFRGKRRLGVI